MCGLLLSTITEANPKLILSIGTATSIASMAIQYKAKTFTHDLYEKALQGDVVADAKFTTFQKHMPCNTLTMLGRATAQTGTTFIGIAAATKKGLGLFSPIITSVFCGTAIGFAVNDYRQLKNAMKAASAITAESIQADRKIGK